MTIAFVIISAANFAIIVVLLHRLRAAERLNEQFHAAYQARALSETRR